MATSTSAGTATTKTNLNQKLLGELASLTTDANKAQEAVDRSHDALYDVLAKCLELTSTYGKDCPEAKQTVRNCEDLHERPEPFYIEDDWTGEQVRPER